MSAIRQCHSRIISSREKNITSVSVWCHPVADIVTPEPAQCEAVDFGVLTIPASNKVSDPAPSSLVPYKSDGKIIETCPQSSSHGTSQVTIPRKVLLPLN
ncbi:hypothetical protein SK128_021719, partial [Halocaridina rubra]